VEGNRELVEIDCIHEVESISVTVEELDRPPLETRLIERVGPSIGLLNPGLALEVSGFDLVERGRTAGRGSLHLNLLDHVRRAVDLDNHAPLEILGRYHALVPLASESPERRRPSARPEIVSILPNVAPAGQNDLHSAPAHGYLAVARNLKGWSCFTP